MSGSQKAPRQLKRTKSEERRKKLTEIEYYHYYLPREEVESLVPKVGDFLLRESVMPDKRAAIVLSVRAQTKVKHFPAEFNADDNLFYFAEDVGRGSVIALVDYHLENRVPVRGCLLSNPIPRNHWEILDDQIQFEEKVLGEGNFAVVRRGKFLIKDRWVDVACKKLKMDRCKSKYDKDKAKFQILREFQIGRMLAGHSRILTVHGIYVGTEELAVIMELCDGGALDKYVMETNNIAVYEKINYFMHAANGLNHMHKLNLIHRDVASRNFLVVKRDKEKLLPLIKVADFGLTRPGPIYRMTTEHEVPYLISALECLDDNPIWTIKSDCWSYGVFMWHIFNNCNGDPYADLLVVNSAALRELLKAGTRLAPQPNMPAECQMIMAECFNENPVKRPDMKEIQHRLEPALRRLWAEAQSQ